MYVTRKFTKFCCEYCASVDRIWMFYQPCCITYNKRYSICRSVTTTSYWWSPSATLLLLSRLDYGTPYWLTSRPTYSIRRLLNASARPIYFISSADHINDASATFPAAEYHRLLLSTSYIVWWQCESDVCCEQNPAESRRRSYIVFGVSCIKIYKKAQLTQREARDSLGI